MTAAQTVLLATSGGYGLLARLGDLATRQRGGKAFLSVEAGERALVGASGSAKRVGCLNASWRLLVF